MFIPITNTPRPYAWGSERAISDLLGTAPTGAAGTATVTRGDTLYISGDEQTLSFTGAGELFLAAGRHWQGSADVPEFSGASQPSRPS